MNHRITRGLDVAVALMAVGSFVLRRSFEVPVAVRAVFAAMLVYTVRMFSRRAPYRPSDRRRR